MNPLRRIGLMSAMHAELAEVLHQLPDEQRQHAASRDFWVGHWHGHEVVAVLSRIGKVAAATTATALIERFGVTHIVFTGVAGGLAANAAVGDVVLADAFLQHDMDASPLFPRHEVPLYGRTRFETDPALTATLQRAATEMLANPVDTLGAAAVDEFHLGAPHLHRGLVISGDRFVATSQESQALRQRLPDALAVEMEGAAVAQVCHDYGVPLAAMRTVSDRADDQAHVDFTRFIDKVASRYSAAALDHFFRML